MSRLVTAAPAADGVRTEASPRILEPARTAPLFAAFLVLAGIAFWPSYLSRLGASSAYTHLHAVTATLWMALLIAPPALIRTRRLTAHRVLGRVSYVVAPLVVASMLMLAHNNLQGLEGDAFFGQSYVLYLQISLATLFAASYGLAAAYRRRAPVHARFMILTAFTLIDPVTVRLLIWAFPGGTWYQWATFFLTDAALLAVIWLDRDAPRGRWVFRAALPVFVVAQIPALLGWFVHPVWQSFARWYQALPLT